MHKLVTLDDITYETRNPEISAHVMVCDKFGENKEKTLESS